MIQYPNHNYRTGLKNRENYVWICAPVSDLDQAVVLCKFDSFGSMAVKRTISRWPDKVEDTFPKNIDTAGPSKHSSWKRLEELKESFLFVFRRRLEDVLIKTNIFALQVSLQKTCSRRRKDVWNQDQYIRLDYTSLKRLQDVFKTSLRRLQDVLPRRVQDVLKTS